MEMWPFLFYLKRGTPKKSKRLTLIRAKQRSFVPHTRALTRDQPGPPGDEDPEQGDSLLNNNNKVKGRVISFETYKVDSCRPNAGVYCIYCTANGMHYVGEAINIKDRFKEHYDRLLSGQAENSNLFVDWNIHGASCFEFIIHNTSNNMEEFTFRLSLQKELQAILSDLNLCYNTGFNETLTPRETGRWPSQAGIGLIYCKSTNTYYMTGTAQRGGVKGRMHSIRAQLRKGTFSNKELQKDWITYGEAAFILEPFDFGNTFANKSNSELREHTTEVIRTFVSRGYRFYNVKSSLLKDSANLPQIKYVRAFESHVDLYFPPGGRYKDMLPINMSGRKCIVAEGNTYLSIVEAAGCLGTHQNVINDRLKNGRYREASREEITAELVLREKLCCKKGSGNKNNKRYSYPGSSKWGNIS